MTDKVKFLRVKDISEKYAVAESTIWKWVGEGKLPPHYAKLSRKCTVWNAEEIDKAFEDMHSNPKAEYNSLNFKVA